MTDAAVYGLTAAEARDVIDGQVTVIERDGTRWPIWPD